MTPDHNIDHAISAASLVLAILAALYTLWLGDVGRALNVLGHPDPENRGPQKDQVLSALCTKAVPLVATSVLSFTIMVPRAFAIVCEIPAHWRTGEFDDVKAFFVLTATLVGLLAGVAGAQVRGLALKYAELNR